MLNSLFRNPIDFFSIIHSSFSIRFSEHWIADFKSSLFRCALSPKGRHSSSKIETLENTLLYIQLEKNLFKNVSDDKFIIKAIRPLEEAVKLGEVGFEPFMVVNGVQLMRKRK